MSKMNIKLEESDFTSNDIMTDIAEWKNVVIFYSLRLLIAPLIETIILLDRLLFILESGKYHTGIGLFHLRFVDVYHC